MIHCRFLNEAKSRLQRAQWTELYKLGRLFIYLPVAVFHGFLSEEIGEKWLDVLPWSEPVLRRLFARAYFKSHS